MNGGANAPKLEQRPSSAVALLRRMERRVGFCEFRFDTPQLAAGRFIAIVLHVLFALSITSEPPAQQYRFDVV